MWSQPPRQGDHWATAVVTQEWNGTEQEYLVNDHTWASDVMDLLRAHEVVLPLPSWLPVTSTSHPCFNQGGKSWSLAQNQHLLRVLWILRHLKQRLWQNNKLWGIIWRRYCDRSTCLSVFPPPQFPQDSLFLRRRNKKGCTHGPWIANQSLNQITIKYC